MKTKEVMKTVIVFDGIINLENKLGLLLPRDVLIKEIKYTAKKYKEKISIKEIEKILRTMLLAGVVFYPRTDYVERITAYKEFLSKKELTDFGRKK